MTAGGLFGSTPASGALFGATQSSLAPVSTSAATGFSLGGASSAPGGHAHICCGSLLLRGTTAIIVALPCKSTASLGVNSGVGKTQLVMLKEMWMGACSAGRLLFWVGPRGGGKRSSHQRSAGFFCQRLWGFLIWDRHCGRPCRQQRPCCCSQLWSLQCSCQCARRNCALSRWAVLLSVPRHQ